MKSVEVKCMNCGTAVMKYASSLKKAPKGKVFCSKDCYVAYRSGSNNPNWKGKSEKRKCKNCGKEFDYIPRKSQPTRGQYCSLRCKKAGTTKTLSPAEAKVILEEIKSSACTLPTIAKTYGTTDRILKRMLTEHYPDQYESAIEARRMGKDEWYKKGRFFEITTKKLLEKKGYIVMLAPHSKGAADLIALKNGRVLCIQCKLYGTMTKSERIALREFAAKAGGTAVLCCPDENGSACYYGIDNKPGKKRNKLEV